MNNFLTQKDWRAEFIYEGVTYGYFNRGDLEFGAETGELTDPEDGTVITGGRQTAEDVPLTRPYKKGRDTAAFKTLKPLRGRGGGQLIIHEKDPDTGQPVSSTPLDTLKVILSTVGISDSDAGGNDNSEFRATVKVQA